MQALVNVIVFLWNGLAVFLTWVRQAVPFLFNKVWLAGVLMVGILWTMFHKASALLGTLIDKLDGMQLGTFNGHAPSIGGSSTIVTLRGWLEFGNSTLPITEAFTFLVGYVSLVVLLFAMKMLFKLIPNPFGWLGR